MVVYVLNPVCGSSRSSMASKKIYGGGMDFLDVFVSRKIERVVVVVVVVVVQLLCCLVFCLLFGFFFLIF